MITREQADLLRERYNREIRENAPPPASIDTPRSGQESIWSYPVHWHLRPCDKRVRILGRRRVLADTRSALTICRRGVAPVYFLPPGDVRGRVVKQRLRDQIPTTSDTHIGKMRVCKIEGFGGSVLRCDPCARLRIARRVRLRRSPLPRQPRRPRRSIVGTRSARLRRAGTRSLAPSLTRVRYHTRGTLVDHPARERPIRRIARQVLVDDGLLIALTP